MNLPNSWMKIAFSTVLALAFTVTLDAVAAGGSVSGNLTYKSKGGPITSAMKFAWLVKGPDDFDPKITVRRLIFSATDIGAKIMACKTITCMQSEIGNGMTIDLGAGSRLNYWISLNDQRVQYSGGVPPSALKLTTDTSTRVAGKLTFDDTAADGPKVDFVFDAPLVQ